jgi:4-amino-4-deoxy-L-arabinose transferase-like glycosyltransferase
VSQDGPDRRLLFWFVPLLLIPLAWVLVLQLGVSGLLGPDEPRYSSIGRAMAESGDWVTPKLNGSPWFEKPPLLYWLAGAGFKAGLDPSTAPRLPVAILSLLALAVWTWAIALVETARIAVTSLAILATTAGWSSLSMIAVTDLPLAACFGLALAFGFVAMELDSRAALAASGVFLGMAILAKGLVPLVLFLPFCFWAREQWRRLPWLLAVAILVASPWYVLMTARHGWAFVDVFFLQHHFGRFASEALQHVRPVWFYVPVLLAGLFPWTPLLLLLDRSVLTDARGRIWIWTAAFGIVFFSLSTNKLPGYLLPLFPALSMILTRAVMRAASAGRTLASCLFLLALAPAIASLLPDALLHGLGKARLSEVHWEYFAMSAPGAIAVLLLDRRGWRVAAVTSVAAGAALGLLFVKLSAAPVLGEIVSARGLARRVAPNAADTCVDTLHRNYRFGLDYYLKRELPSCDAAPSMRFRISQEPGRLPQISPR